MLLTTNWQAHDNYQYGFTTGDSRHSFMQLKVKQLVSGFIIDQSLHPDDHKQLLNWKNLCKGCDRRCQRLSPSASRGKYGHLNQFCKILMTIISHMMNMTIIEMMMTLNTKRNIAGKLHDNNIDDDECNEDDDDNDDDDTDTDLRCRRVAPQSRSSNRPPTRSSQSELLMPTIRWHPMGRWFVQFKTNSCITTFFLALYAASRRCLCDFNSGWLHHRLGRPVPSLFATGLCDYQLNSVPAIL